MTYDEIVASHLWSKLSKQERTLLRRAMQLLDEQNRPRTEHDIARLTRAEERRERRNRKRLRDQQRCLAG